MECIFTSQGKKGVRDGVERILSFLILIPSVIMALLMISFNLFGNGLRDAFNPSLKGSD